MHSLYERLEDFTTGTTFLLTVGRLGTNNQTKRHSRNNYDYASVKMSMFIPLKSYVSS